MIIECINCNKKFNVEQNLIPEDGRHIVCGSCNYSWHYKIQISKQEKIISNQINENKEYILYKEPLDNSQIKKNIELSEIKIKDYDIETNVNRNSINTKRKTIAYTSINFFSYLVVFIISFIAFILITLLVKASSTDVSDSGLSTKT